MKFIKQILIDILMLPVIFELGSKVNKGVELADEHLSSYAKWVTSLIEE